MKIFYPSRIIGVILLSIVLVFAFILYKYYFNQGDKFFFFFYLIFELILLYPSLTFIFKKQQKVELKEDYLEIINALSPTIKVKWGDIKIIIPKHKILKIIPSFQIGVKAPGGEVKEITLLGYKQQLIEEIINRAYNSELGIKFIYNK
jgi:hypothetical protein